MCCWGGVIYVPVAAVLFLIGTALFAFYTLQPDQLPASVDAANHPDRVLPYFIVHELPTGLAGIVIAAGGVGVISVMLLAKLGYQVTAVSGKPDQHDWLRALGASDVIGREEVNDDSDRPLLKSRWAGAVDTVGGNTLATLIRSLNHRGCVTACGLVGGTDLPLTVFPFILRGAKLDGIDSAQCPYDRRLQIWKLLSGDWKIDNLQDLVTEISLDEAKQIVDQMMQGKTHGRHIVRPT